MCFFSRFLKLFFLPALAGTFPALAGALAMQPPVARGFSLPVQGYVPAEEPALCRYVFAADFFLAATVPRRGPLRVRALVCVRCPWTGKLRRCRVPRDEPVSINR